MGARHKSTYNARCIIIWMSSRRVFTNINHVFSFLNLCWRSRYYKVSSCTRLLHLEPTIHYWSLDGGFSNDQIHWLTIFIYIGVIGEQTH